MTNDAKLTGVGGWLILPIIGFFGVIVMTIYNLVTALQGLEGLRFMVSGNDPRFSGMVLPMVLSLVLGIAVIGSASTCLYRIFLVGHGVVKFTTIHYAILICAGLVDLWLLHAISVAVPDTSAEDLNPASSVKTVFYSLLWALYFLKSERVQNTFESASLKFNSKSAEAAVIDDAR